MSQLLEIEHLNIRFVNGGKETEVVSDLSLSLDRRETLGIVGESGSGKSVTSLSIMRLHPDETTRIKGAIRFEDKDLLALSEREMQDIRGNKIAMIFQEPMTSLNPIHTVGKQIAESVLLHSKATKKEAMARARQLLELCGIPDPDQRMKEYPHQLSGGMRQRVMIAIALACDPELLIADEPTTALDVTIQAQILELMKAIKKDRDMSIIMITHDLGIVYDFCDRVVVMYTGEVVESAPVKELFAAPLHPYTEGLIGALPRLGQPTERLSAIEGMVPDAGDMPQGCHFHPRCPYATERCRAEHPPLTTLPDGRQVRCFRGKGEQ
ncbi:peptide ABC transporter ATP-binding protein [Flavonifractor sp. An92]|uniref:ABC transporter ATP-binding protein n=1 Tax=Flavonifractor sp. An92 TaxID=1965666 RepID=UPI000B3730B7|nr:peptide ABC transporter ATP-binding protein [Flavonifractor sp. An92]OUQ24141.1 peptide ABC transporter ATP-binding protein [Flavonifractor sp. An135]